MPFLLITLSFGIIFWEVKISIFAVLQVEFYPILGVYKTWAAQRSVVSVWFSSSWCTKHVQKETDLDCRQASQAHTLYAYKATLL